MPASRGKILKASLLRRPIFFICDPIQNHILIVGANSRSPEGGEALLQAKAEGKKWSVC
jgi:hypothetical protein